MRVRDLMNYPLLTIRRDSFVKEAMRLMNSEEKGCILICDECLKKNIEGILTMTMILNKVYAAGKNPEEIKVFEIMKPSCLARHP
jgi:predicted transcriptional regulator